jgi:hypothetical protein
VLTNVHSRTKAAVATDVWMNDGSARAGVDGVCAGSATLLSAGAAAAILVTITHLRLSRKCDANWERELRCLANDDGGRNNRSYG